ncbi:hypothetical protein [Nocardia sp. CA-290969]|uniref:hypothetical protein n=1 Tax=Nocardia sp. CA-290969 TaxID=3239986 RepID=UPI003D8EF89C
MPEVAKKATLDLAQKKLFVNGEEFPWRISEDGPQLDDLVSPLRRITLTFYAHDVEVIPAKTIAMEKAALRVEQARREVADAQLRAKEAGERLLAAHAEAALAEAEAKGQINWTKDEDGE